MNNQNQNTPNLPGIPSEQEPTERQVGGRELLAIAGVAAAVAGTAYGTLKSDGEAAYLQTDPAAPLTETFTPPTPVNEFKLDNGSTVKVKGIPEKAPDNGILLGPNQDPGSGGEAGLGRGSIDETPDGDGFLPSEKGDAIAPGGFSANFDYLAESIEDALTPSTKPEVAPTKSERAAVFNQTIDEDGNIENIPQKFDDGTLPGNPEVAASQDLGTPDVADTSRLSPQIGYVAESVLDALDNALDKNDETDVRPPALEGVGPIDINPLGSAQVPGTDNYTPKGTIDPSAN